MTKTKNHNGENGAPTALAEATLKRYDVLAAALAATGVEIPKALAAEREARSSLGGAEIENGDVAEPRQRLASAVAEREAAARRRAVATEALLKLEPDLNRARAAVDQARSEIGATVIREFGERWGETCARLLALRAEAVSLSKVLGVAVAAPAPFTTRINPINGAAELRLAASPEPAPPVSLPPALTALADLQARLDCALSLCAGVRQARELTTRHYLLDRARGSAQPTGGIFQVVRAFTALGSAFQEGALVDASILPAGLLTRFWQGRNIRPLEAATVAA
jgi:hypothetical protein